MSNLLKRPLCIAAVFSLFLSTSANLYSAQDHIKENPQLDLLMTDVSPQNRDQLNKLLSSMSPEDRAKLIQSMIDVALRTQKEGINVETVFGRFRTGAENQTGLTVRSLLSQPGQPLMDSERAELAKLLPNGVVEIGQIGIGGPKGAAKHVRVVVIMQRQIELPVEFALPLEGSVLIVQRDDAWITVPPEYNHANHTIAIKPSAPNVTSIDYNVGPGRQGSEAFFWDR